MSEAWFDQFFSYFLCLKIAYFSIDNRNIPPALSMGTWVMGHCRGFLHITYSIWMSVCVGIQCCNVGQVSVSREMKHGTPVWQLQSTEQIKLEATLTLLTLWARVNNNTWIFTWPIVQLVTAINMYRVEYCGDARSWYNHIMFTVQFMLNGVGVGGGGGRQRWILMND